MNELKLLLLEDMVSDAELIIHTLEESGLDFVPVLATGKEDYIKALRDFQFDAILADNTMPQFSASEALEIYNEKGLTTPFILVTGSISEEFAVEIMKLGACDYILKDRMQRLPSAVLAAVHKRKLETERKKYLEEVIANEALMKDAAALAHFGSWEADMVHFVQRWSDEQYRILGYEPGEIEASITNFLLCVHPEDLDIVKEIIDESFRQKDRQKYECRIVTKDGTLK
ncbi:MAG: domain S-box protein, partial [Flavipsychrobacter sp.]|nr:domain S-box protein [Flavipsychrobacter sp.]